MSIDEILNEMDEILEDSINLPFSGGKRMVDVDHIRELMGEIKLNLPDEVRQAKAIVQDRADIVAAAKKEADAIIHRAGERANRMVSETEIVKASQAKANEIITATQQQSREMRKQALDYCSAMMRQSEEELTRRARALRDARGNLTRGSASGGSGSKE